MEFTSLKNKERAGIIEDVLLYPLKINQDESGGILVETLRNDWVGIYGRGREFFMQYYSVTDPDVARDENIWHYHPVQEDRFLLVQGEVVVAVADVRKESSTNGKLNLFLMKAYLEPYVLLIPANTLHGFLVVSKEPAILLNFPTGLYNLQEEKRISHKEGKVKFLDGTFFSWDLVRKVFKNSSSQ
ncbi:hypothetical protein A3F29_00465 [Candidatus Roizmanbacteria bacterium RIFCSPHIGHO2_12_FULL_33_9]|uniref:dTDP-4-dehydrorhamnose 3,5-epimerase n=1 Tax=Candidatus Roizmanbacteria bacterium RIFCSPHIGHO2_12_FULL_33_9 TaxID=1802045 RepID=A0A1F7HI67_9BACT|nr:MAG: hypothetical protein A3F29_00465 [Candidatus Roizmanbacteria bacterium RIFCSPHIGHO2_12_FULL_33_9]